MIITRGNTTAFAFVFKDADGVTVTLASATVQLVYPGKDADQTETLTLVDTSDTWEVTWDSSKSRSGWIHFHAHGISSNATEYAEDGRFLLTGNEPSLQHDALPEDTNDLTDYRQ